MSKREKIIVGLMVLAVLYGIYAIFFEAKFAQKKKAPVRTGTAASVDGFVAEITKNMVDMKQSESGQYVLNQAEAQWEKNPFLETEMIPQSELNLAAKETVDVGSLFTYSGYLKMGKRGMAIINGLEYEVGEVIEDAGYMIRKITPTQVVIGMADNPEEFVLLIAETE